MLKPEIIQTVIRAKSDQELRLQIWIGKFKIDQSIIDAEKLRRKNQRQYSQQLQERGEF